MKYTNGDTEWICFKTKKDTRFWESTFRKKGKSPQLLKSVTSQPSNASSEANDSNNVKESSASMQSQGTVRRRSSRRSAQQKRKYVFSDSEDDDDDDSDSDTAMTDGRKKRNTILRIKRGQRQGIARARKAMTKISHCLTWRMPRMILLMMMMWTVTSKQRKKP